MRDKFIYSNHLGNIHHRTHVSEVDIEEFMSKCAYCTLEDECMARRLPCDIDYLYRSEDEE